MSSAWPQNSEAVLTTKRATASDPEGGELVRRFTLNQRMYCRQKKDD